MSPTYLEILRSLDDLPDTAIVPRSVAAIVLNRSERSLKRSDPAGCPWIKTGDRTGGYRAGDLRALTRGEPTTSAA
jgi:hypothetical protein